jgi:hypothetical protein
VQEDIMDMIDREVGAVHVESTWPTA